MIFLPSLALSQTNYKCVCSKKSISPNKLHYRNY